MALPNASHLSSEQLKTVLANFPADDEISVERIRSHNGGEIRSAVTMRLGELSSLLVEALDEGHLPGGDLEVVVPGLNKRLVGHHDGVFWLEACEATPNKSPERTRER